MEHSRNLGQHIKLESRTLQIYSIIKLSFFQFGGVSKYMTFLVFFHKHRYKTGDLLFQNGDSFIFEDYVAGFPSGGNPEEAFFLDPLNPVIVKDSPDFIHNILQKYYRNFGKAVIPLQTDTPQLPF